MKPDDVLPNPVQGQFWALTRPLAFSQCILGGDNVVHFKAWYPSGIVGDGEFGGADGPIVFVWPANDARYLWSSRVLTARVAEGLFRTPVRVGDVWLNRENNQLFFVGPSHEGLIRIYADWDLDDFVDPLAEAQQIFPARLFQPGRTLARFRPASEERRSGVTTGMAFEIKPGRFITRIIYFETSSPAPRGNIMGWIYRDSPEDDWRLYYRIRYYVDDDLTRNSKDRRSAFALTKKGSFEEVVPGMVNVLKVISLVSGGHKFDEIVVDSDDPEFVMGKLGEQSWAHGTVETPAGETIHA